MSNMAPSLKTAMRSTLWLVMILCGASAQSQTQLVREPVPLPPQPEAAVPEQLPPTSCLETGPQLLQAIRDYYAGGVSMESQSSAAQTYGWPIASWCLSPGVANKLEKDPSPLQGHLASAVERIVNVHMNDDVISTLEADDLMAGWDVSRSSATCVALCSEEDDDDDDDASPNPPYVGNNETQVEYEDDEEGQAPAEDSASDSYASNTEEEDEDEQGRFPPGETESESYTYNTEGEEEVDQGRFPPEDNASESYTYNTEEEDEQDHALPVDSASQSYADPSDIMDNDEEIIYSGSSSARNKTTTGMLIRLIPVKLLVVLSLMCVFLGMRQMVLSAESDGYHFCCCCKQGLFGFGSRGGYANYEGIDPSDVSDHQKSVEFELLQLAASGEDVDVEIDVEIS